MRRLISTGLCVLAGSVCTLSGQRADRVAVFTAEQAASGKIEIRKNAFGACTDCHTTALTGRQGAPGELPPLDSLSADYQKLVTSNGGLNLIAYTLQANGAVAGTQPLTSETDVPLRKVVP